jgi:hypothetical protein
MKLNPLFAAAIVLTATPVFAAQQWVETAQPRVLPMVHSQSAEGVKEVGYGYRYRYDYRPYYGRYGYYRPRYQPYYGYPLDMETYAVWRKRPTVPRLLRLAVSGQADHPLRPNGLPITSSTRHGLTECSRPPHSAQRSRAES